MKALIIKKPGEARVLEIPKPVPSPDEVLIKVSYCGLCGTDSVIYSGETMFVTEGLIKYPIRIGHEYSGIVDSVGSNVTKFKKGDRVVSENFASCGNCEYCQAGNYHLCKEIKSLGTINTWDGAFTEYLVMPKWHVYNLPDNISLEEAALIEPSTVALSGIERCNIKKESNVLIIGTGAIGLACIPIVKALYGANVYVSGRKESKLDLALKLGANGIINSTKESLEEKISTMTDGKMADVILETSGNTIVINDCLDAACERADFALIGFYEEMQKEFNIDKLVVKQINMKGILTDSKTVPRIIDLLSSKKISLIDLITHRYALDDVPNILENIDEYSKTKVKIMIKV